MIGLFDSVRRRVRGVPSLPGDSPVEIAKEVIKGNAKKVLYCGSGRSWFMRPADFAKGLRGLEKVLSPSYLRGLLEFMIGESFRLKRVPGCFSPLRGFDLASPGQDGLPLLVYSIAEYCRWVGDRRLYEENEAALQWLLSQHERLYFNSPAAASGADALCALKMLGDARGLGLKLRTDPKTFENAVLKNPWTEDGAALALYFQLFDKNVRETLIKKFEADGAARPDNLPLRLLRLNGLKKSGKNISADKADLDALIMSRRQTPEAVSPSSEYGFTLSAALYLELALD